MRELDRPGGVGGDQHGAGEARHGHHPGAEAEARGQRDPEADLERHGLHPVGKDHELRRRRSGDAPSDDDVGGREEPEAQRDPVAEHAPEGDGQPDADHGCRAGVGGEVPTVEVEPEGGAHVAEGERALAKPREAGGVGVHGREVVREGRAGAAQGDQPGAEAEEVLRGGGCEGAGEAQGEGGGEGGALGAGHHADATPLAGPTGISPCALRSVARSVPVP
jgi:hypothetical protein